MYRVLYLCINRESAERKFNKDLEKIMNHLDDHIIWNRINLTIQIGDSYLYEYSGSDYHCIRGKEYNKVVYDED